MTASVAAALLTLALLLAATGPNAGNRLLVDNSGGSGGADQSFDSKLDGRSAPVRYLGNRRHLSRRRRARSPGGRRQRRPGDGRAGRNQRKDRR